VAANEDKLGTLHDQVADVLLDLLKGQELTDEEGKVIGTIKPTAATVQAAAKFLKDNNITCAPSDDNKMGELRDALAEKNQRREQRRATRAELAEAKESAGFLHGMH